jgi:hypothetical protein
VGDHTLKFGLRRALSRNGDVVGEWRHTPRDAASIDQIDLPAQFEAGLANGDLAALGGGDEGDHRAAGVVGVPPDLR